MKCSIKGCIGEYQEKMIVHTVSRKNDIFIFEHVPADVCSVCGDTIFKPDIVRRLESLIQQKNKPKRFVPLYEYA